MGSRYKLEDYPDGAQVQTQPKAFHAEVPWKDNIIDVYEKPYKEWSRYSLRRVGTVSGTITVNPKGTNRKARADLGFLYYEVIPDDKYSRIIDVVVTSKVQGIGLGKQLVTLAEGRICHHGVKKVCLDPAVKEAWSFWERMGYKHREGSKMERELSCR